MAKKPAKTAPAELDATDRRILRALRRDGRLSIVALAEEVGLSPTPCQRRVRRLEEEGVIAGYTAVLDHARLGLPLQAFVLVALESHAEEAVSRLRGLRTRSESVRHGRHRNQCTQVRGRRARAQAGDGPPAAAAVHRR